MLFCYCDITKRGEKLIMEDRYNIKALKNLGQWVVCPMLAFSIAVKAIKAGNITGYFGFLFGALIFIAMWALLLTLYHKLFVERIIAKNEAAKEAERARIRSIMEAENDPDVYPEDDD